VLHWPPYPLPAAAAAAAAAATAPWPAAGGLFPSPAAPLLPPGAGGPSAGLLTAHPGPVDALLPFGRAPTEVPPPGCAPDAYKLFIGNVPSCYNERVRAWTHPHRGAAPGLLRGAAPRCPQTLTLAITLALLPTSRLAALQDLRPLFESIGPVVELVVLYDKQTGASKGSAFVWYSSRLDADRAATQFNDRHLLPDPTGHQQRPLVVRPATVRRAVPRSSLLLPQPPGIPPPAGAAVTPTSAAAAAAAALGGFSALGAAAAAGRMQQHLGLAAGRGAAGLCRSPVQQVMLGGDAGAAALSNSSFLMDTAALAAAAGDPTGGDVSFASAGYAIAAAAGGANSGPDSGSYATLSGNNAGGGGAGGPGGWDPAGAGAGLQYVPMAQQQALGALPRAPGLGHGHGPASGGASSSSEVVSVQVPVLAGQLSAVTPHVFNIQSASGADVTTHAVAPGVFCLRVAGSKVAVDAASHLISSIIQNST
jgi:CUG-BP- and ETR3-like factor